MSIQDKVNIFDILDMFNEEVGYKGLGNTDKSTDERDDVISRQTFNNWLKEYNATHSRQIKSQKVNQYHNEWFKSDIEKLMQDKKIQKKLKHAYLRGTVPLFEEWKDIGFLSEQRVSKRYMEAQNELREQGNSEELSKSIKRIINQLINEVIENHFTLFFEGNRIDGKYYIKRSEIIKNFIDEKKIEEEALKIVDNYYGFLEYDNMGNIVNVHDYEERKETRYFLKSIKDTKC